MSNAVLSLTNDEIKDMCKRDQKKLECIRRLKIRRYNLNRGKPIEIPVLPFRSR